MAQLCSDLVKDLLENQQKELATLKEKVAAVIPASGKTQDGVEVDDIFFLRFILSARGDLELAAERVVKALEWRAKNAEKLVDLANGKRDSKSIAMSEYLYSGISGTLKGGEPLSVVRLGLSDCKTLMAKFSVEEVSECMTWEKEKIFRICDNATRSTGRLIKSVTIIDFSGFTLMGGRFDRKVLTALGASSKLSSVVFPQLQVKCVALNVPSFAGWISKALAAVMPKSSMEKMVLCQGKKSSNPSDCTFCSTYGVLDALPHFLGGNADSPYELLTTEERRGAKRNLPPLRTNSFENDAEVSPISGLPSPTEAEKSKSKGENKNLDNYTPISKPFELITIAQRAYAVVKVPVEKRGSVVSFEVMVEQHSLKLSAVLIPESAAISPSSNNTGNGSTKTRQVAPDSDEDDYDEGDTSDGDDSGDLDAGHRRKRSQSVEVLRKLSVGKEALQKLSSPFRGTRNREDNTVNYEEVRQRTKSDPDPPRRVESESEPDAESPTVQVFKKWSRFRKHRDNLAMVKTGPIQQLQSAMVPIKVSSKHGLVRGEWAVPSTGVLVFTFDNSFSKIRSKKALFRMELREMVSRDDMKSQLKSKGIRSAQIVSRPQRLVKQYSATASRIVAQSASALTLPRILAALSALLFILFMALEHKHQLKIPA